ncbi:MAG: transglutaminase domain-containing protein [Agathobacter sp.]|nr:transglutaminase domain-containing protein [Agathobacter sp.]
MERTWRKAWKMLLACLLCIAMLMPREKVDIKFAMTDRLRDELCYYDELYHQYFLKGRIVSEELVDSGDGIIFDFNEDQMGIPAKEGDYLIYNARNAGVSYIDSYSTPTTISLTASWFLTTAVQEAEFDAKLTSLFASGGALAYTKSLSKAEAVIECMKYINANVKSVSSYQDVDHSGYGVLCKGQATCEGKSLLLYRLLREVGIPNRILMGTDAAAQTPSIEGIEDETTEVVPEEETEDISTNISDDAKPDVDSGKKDGVPGYVGAIVIIILVAVGVVGVIWYRKKNISEREE